MHNLTCFIVDDNPDAIDTVRQYVEQTRELKCIGTSTSATDFLRKLREGLAPDLVFLDIEMPIINGLELSAQLPAQTHIIFVSGHPEYGAEAFDVDSVDFLRKPLSYARFYQAVNKAFKRILAEENVRFNRSVAGNYLFNEIRPLYNSSRKVDSKPAGALTDDLFFVFSKNNGLNDLRRFSEILYVEGLDTYVQLHFTGDRKNIFHRSLTSTEKVLPSYFIRIHRSYIINTLYIKSVSVREVYLESVDKPVPIGKTYKQNLLDFMQGRILGNEY